MLFFGAAYVFFAKVEKYIAAYPYHLLTSPLGLNIFPLSFSAPKNLSYLSKKNKKLGTQSLPSYKRLFAFSPIFAAILTSGLISIFFFFAVKMNIKDIFFLILSISLLLYYFLFIDYITIHELSDIFYLFNFLVSIPFVYFVRSLLDKKTPPVFFWMMLLLSIILFNRLPPSTFEEELLMLSGLGFFRSIVFIYCLFLFLVYIKNIFSEKSEPKPVTETAGEQELAQNSLKAFLGIIFTLGFHADIIILTLFGFFEARTNTNYNVFFFLPAFAISLYSFLGFRFGLISLKIVIREFLLRLLFFGGFTFLYIFLIGFQLISVFDNEKDLLLNIVLVLLLLFLLDPLLTVIVFFLDHARLRRNAMLREHLSQIYGYFNDPHSLPIFFNKIRQAIQDGLEINAVKLCFAQDTLRNTNLREDFIIYDYSIWEQIKKKKKFIKYPVFTEWSGGKVSQFIKKENAFALVSFQQYDAAVLVFRKKTGGAFFSSDIRFLKSLVKHSDAFLANYQFTLETTKIKRHENELLLAANIQKDILPEEYQDDHIQLRIIIQPFQKVTGDYIGFFKKYSKEYLLFLGDVSGHGLGSSYLMSVMRSIIRASVQVSKENLNQIFSKIDRYLVNDYRGNDFITLTGMQIKIFDSSSKKKQAEIEFINAGQHPALIYLKKSKQIEKLISNQRVIGVIDTKYTSAQYTVKESCRIFLYSDGIFEILDKEGNMIGEKKVEKWIMESNHLKVNNQKKYILEKIEEKSLYIMDDISLVIAEILL